MNIPNKGLTKIPIQFGKVKGNFWCEKNKLTTLKSAPREVYGIFSCYRNKLTTLQGAPQYVK